MTTPEKAAEYRVFRTFDGWAIQGLFGPEGDQTWTTVDVCQTEAEARRLAGLAPKGKHRANPVDSRFTESWCKHCGGRVVSRANQHGYAVWRHQKSGR